MGDEETATKTAEEEKAPEAEATEDQETLVGGNEDTAGEDDGPAIGVAPEGEPGEAPVEYDIKANEDSLLDGEAVQEITAFSKDQKFSAAQAQAVFDKVNEAVKGYADALVEQHRTTVAAWREAAKADKEIGGPALERAVADANEVVDRWAPPGFKRLLRETAVGNHPDTIKFLKRVRAEFDPDKFVSGAPADSAAPKTYAQRIYGDEPKGK